MNCLLLVLTTECQRENFRGVFVFSTACSVDLQISQRLHIIIEMLSEEEDFGEYTCSIVTNVMMKSNLWADNV